MKNKFRLLCASGALAVTLAAGVALTACNDGFGIVTPSADAENVSTCPVISWTAEPNATLYHMEIATDGAYKNVVREGTTAGLSYTVGNALSHATQYYLRVNALKEEDDKTVCLNSAESKFKTEAAHSTDAPDYAAARTLYDFESFEGSEALREEFPRHVDGNELGVSLVEGGVNGSKAMQIDYTAGNKGWAGVTCKLPADKKVWSGAKGIRMWVKGDGLGTNIEVRIGKRGYQSWAATFSVNNPDACYVSIPFSAFDDIGGGDGIWDLAGITRFWLFFTGSSNSRVLIDDITIGSDANYTTDNRSEIETSLKAPAGLYDDFNGYADDEAMQKKWMFEFMSESTLAESPYSTGKALKLVPSKGWATARLNLPNYDFTEMGSIRFKASAGTYVIQLETSLLGVFEKENIVVARDGDEAGVNIADLVPRAGTEGGAKLIHQLVIGLSGKTDKTVYIDDVTFSDETFTPKDYTPKAGVFDDFEAYGADSDLNAVWNGDGATLSLESAGALAGGKSMKVTAGGWCAITLDYPDVSFDGVKSLRFKASAGTYSVRLVGTNWTSYIKDVTVATAGDEAGVNIAELAADNGSKLSGTVRQLYIGFTGSASGVLFDDFTYSDEEIIETDRTAGKIEDFEEMTADTISTFATVNGATLALETENPLTGTKSAKFSAGGAFDFEVNNAYLAKYDFTKTIGFSLAIKMRASAGDSTVIIQIGSYGNVYTATRTVYGNASNNIQKFVVMYDSMKLADGSSGELNKANINYLRVFITQYATDFTAIIDDLQFFTAENYTPEKVTIDDFSSYADDAALQEAWHASNVVLDNGAMKLTTASGWNELQYNFAAQGSIGSADDFQNCYAIAFDVTASVDINLIVKLQRWDNAREATVAVKGGETTHVVVYFSQLALSGENDWSDMIFNYLTLGLTYYGVTDIAFDNIAFLRG